MSNRFVLFDHKAYGIRAGGIVVHEDKILLIHRFRKGKEFYVLPGGGVDPGETVEQGIVREILEETNQTVEVENILYHLDFINDSDQYYGLCRYVGGGELKLNGPEIKYQSEENQHIPTWVPLSEIPSLTLYPVLIQDWLIADAPRFFSGDDLFRHARLTYERQSQ